jgi:peptidyl-prolyl cis-trans isomerase SurA
MFRIRVAGVCALLVVCGKISAQQATSVATTQTLFTVKNSATSTDEFIYLYRKNHPSKEDFTAQKIDEYLNLFINFKLKVTEAKARGIDTTASFVKEYNSYKEELRKPYLPEGKIVDSLVRVTYTRLQEEVRASHILINVKPDASPADTLTAFTKAMEIKQKALSGEDFAALATTYSEDPSARINKGDLGYFTALQMVFPFENAAYSGKKGEVVGPVRTRFGYHLLKIVDKRPARGEVEVSHIMIRTSERDQASAKNLIFELHDQLEGGVSWNDVCKQYSEDQSTKNTGGKLRPFGVGGMPVPEFEQAAFSLQKPGEISDPFQTQYGWHIVRLERKIPLPSFEESAASLKTKVSRDERVQLSKQALAKKLQAQFGYIPNTATIDKVFALADTTLTQGKWSVSHAQVDQETLFSLKQTAYGAGDFIKYVRQQQKPSGLTPEKYIAQLYQSYVDQCINEQLEKQIIQQHPDFALLVKEYYEGILLFDIMEKEVWKKASDDSIGQVKYYRQNSKKYVAGERVQAEIYSAASADVIANTKGLVERNDSTALQKALAAKTIRLEKGTFQKADRPVLSKTEWKPGLYIVNNGGSQYLVHILKMVPPGPLAFTEARTAVISDFQDYLEKAWVAQLKKKYPVKINAKAKGYVVQTLLQ